MRVDAVGNEIKVGDVVAFGVRLKAAYMGIGIIQKLNSSSVTVLPIGCYLKGNSGEVECDFAVASRRKDYESVIKADVTNPEILKLIASAREG